MAYTGPQPGFDAYNPGKGFTVSSGYPFRNNGSDRHWGVDFSAAAGTGIPAAADGVVEKVGINNSTYGNYIVLRHMASDGSNVYTLYAHMQSESPRESRRPFGLSQAVTACSV